MGDHDPVDSCLHRRLERRDVDLLHFGERLRRRSDAEIAVLLGGAEAGPMLGGRAHSRSGLSGLKASHLSRAETRYERHPVTVGTDTVSLVERFDVDVDDWGVVHVDA